MRWSGHLENADLLRRMVRKCKLSNEGQYHGQKYLADAGVQRRMSRLL